MTDHLRQTLKQHSHSITPPRLAIFDYLQKHDAAATAAIITAHPDFDQASAYRALALFKQLGIVQDVVIGGRRLVELTEDYDTRHHHHHLSCRICGSSVTITSDPIIEQRLAHIASQHGLTEASHQIELSGICAKCAK